MFTKEMINDYANKLLFDLSSEETEELLEEFDLISESMEMIENIEGIEKVKPLHFPQDTIICKAYRKDSDTRMLSTRDALRNSGDVIEDVIEVPKVVG